MLSRIAQIADVDATAPVQSIGELLSSSPTSRRLTIVLPLTLAIAALLMALGAPGQALGKGSTAGCASGSSHTGGEARACAQAQRKQSSRARSKAKKHHKHATKKKSKKKAKTKPAAAAPTSQETAVCADSSAPIAAGGGSYTCDDESEPACSNGSEPTVSKGLLVCGVEPGSGAPSCEDGSAPVRSAGGSYGCDDESQPECENGSTPAPSSDGSALVCPPAAVVAETTGPTEEFDSDGISDSLRAS